MRWKQYKRTDMGYLSGKQVKETRFLGASKEILFPIDM
jgi:hypothetical protein